jgi:hypothetical protein
MSLSIVHPKVNNITDWTQADLDAQIAQGNFPPGTTLADITLAQDWNSEHTVSGTLDQSQNNVAVDGVTVTGDGTPGDPLVASSGPVDAGTLTGTTLAANVVNSSLTSVGTLTSLTTSGNITSTDGVNTTLGIYPASGAGPTRIELYEDTDNGTNFVRIDAPTSIASNKVQTLQDVTDTFVYRTTSDALTNKSVNGVTLTADGIAGNYLGEDGTYHALPAGGMVAFTDITSGTNTTAAMVVDTGASLTVAGTGTITATSVIAVDAGGDTTTFPLLAGAATGSTGPLTDAGLTYNATTKALSTTTFIGDLTGNATTATTATNVTVANEATDTTCFPLFATAATGDLGPKSNANLTFNSNTAALGIVSTSLTAFSVGPTSTVANSALIVNCNTASSDNGVTITGGTASVSLDATGADTNVTMTLASKGNASLQLRGGASGTVLIQPSGTTRVTFASTNTSFAPTTSGTASTNRFLVTAANDTALTASAEAPWVLFNGAVTRQHSTGAITTQRDFRIDGTNHSAVGSSTITNVGAFSVSWGNAGSNCTYTHNAAIYIPTQALTGTITNAYGIRVAAPSGASTLNLAISATGTSELGTVQSTRINPRVSSTASSATPTPNADTDDEYILTALAAGATFGAPTGAPVQGQAMIIRIEDNGGAQTLAFNAIYRAIGVTLPTTTVAGKLIYLGMIYNSTDTKWDIIGVSQEA